MAMALVICFFFLLILVLWRLYLIMPYRIKSMIHDNKNILLLKEKKYNIKTVIILGSGGHTAEILRVTSALDRKKYFPLTFVLANTDSNSKEKVMKEWSDIDENSFLTIYRSREVGQSWLTTIFSFLTASIACIRVVRLTTPDLLLCNGPGTCVPLCLIALIFKYVGLTKTKIVFCESFCRVHSLSLTGKILYYLVDRFIVQWPELQRKYPYSEYLGTIC